MKEFITNLGIVIVILIAVLILIAEFSGYTDHFIETAAAAGVETTVTVVIGDEVSSYDVATSGVTASVRCNNTNWEYSPRCIATPDVNALRMTEDGGFEGALLSGVEFRQRNILFGLQKFEMEDVYWYIDKQGTFDASNDFTAFAIYLSRL